MRKLSGRRSRANERDGRYLMRERYNEKYGLLYGAMTADWGDVQPNDDFGCDMNDLSDRLSMYMITLCS